MKKILVVDDDIVSLKSIKSMLSGDYKVIAVNSAEDALEYLKGEIPDLILLDIMMPEIDGFEMMERLSSDKRTEDIPVIFITADEDKDKELQGLTLGAMDFVTKPFEPRIVLSRIEKVLRIEGLRHSLECEAYRDSLTGLWNRKYAVDKVNAVLASPGARGVAFMVDIDNFKGINDTYGHVFGDEVLVKISHVLTDIVRLNDIACRMGGDEFFLYFDGINAIDKIEGIAERLINSLNHNIKYPNSTQGVGGSIGIAMAPADGTSFDSLYTNADMALYAAKKDGKNIYRFFSGDNMAHEVEDVDDGPRELGYIIEMMTNRELSKGAYGVKYRDFGNIVTFVRRNLVRSRIHVAYVLFTLKVKKGQSVAAEVLHNRTSKLEKITKELLRMGDVAARCSSSQVVTMLMNASENDGRLVAERVADKYKQSEDMSDMEITYDVQAFEPASAGQ